MRLHHDEVAVRRLTFWSCATDMPDTGKERPSRFDQAGVDFLLVPEKLEKSCTHSKQLTVTPPAFLVSGGTRMLRLARMSSAAG
jgi:hypothetical protein